MAGSRKPWTPEETTLLRKYRAQGYTVRQISRFLGRTAASVKSRLQELARRGNPARSLA